MGNKVNIAELLKDCPKGMELDCVMFENVTFEGIKHDEYPIIVKIKEPPMALSLTKTGGWNLYNSAKCVIFPKGKTTWEGFVPPCEFKEGDVVVSRSGDIHLLRTEDSSYCAYRVHWTELSKFDSTITTGVKVVRLATEEEKQKLFDAIKANGYKWNEETKTLEKLIEPKFKVGDRIKYKINQYEYTIIDITKDNYIVRYKTDKFDYHVPFWDEDNYDLVPNKFDITTLKPFDKVLVRHNKDNKWCGSFFSHIDGDFHSHCYKYVTIAGKSYPMCIPYEKNEHLLGTTDDCDEYFKNW